MLRTRAFRAGPRQRQILELLMEGRTDPEMAMTLGISKATVRTHLIRLYRDNGVANRTEAVAVWLLSQRDALDNQPASR